MEAVLLPIIVAVSIPLFIFYRVDRFEKREKHILNYRFPNTLKEKVKERYPHLSDRQANQVINGLREYFHICNLSGRKMVAMPSQAVDVAWHEFILFTRQYEMFCKKTFGRFLHHTPAEAMRSPDKAQKGIKRAWKFSCIREKLTPKKAARLPLLFALDTKLKIPDGFKYSLDCSKPGNDSYCASHIGCTSDFGIGCIGDSSDSGGCGGGCGGGD